MTVQFQKQLFIAKDLPISWTSKGRRPRTLFEASLTTANASCNTRAHTLLHFPGHDKEQLHLIANTAYKLQQEKLQSHRQDRIQRLALLRAFSQSKSPLPQFRIRQCGNLRFQSVDNVNGCSVLLSRGFSRVGAFEDAAKQTSEGRHHARSAPPAPA